MKNEFGVKMKNTFFNFHLTPLSKIFQNLLSREESMRNAFLLAALGPLDSQVFDDESTKAKLRLKRLKNMTSEQLIGEMGVV